VYVGISSWTGWGDCTLWGTVVFILPRTLYIGDELRFFSFTLESTIELSFRLARTVMITAIVATVIVIRRTSLVAHMILELKCVIII